MVFKGSGLLTRWQGRRKGWRGGAVYWSFMVELYGEDEG